ncbi:hypothetical protein DFA_09607 [Cavenderia fasciculata]|uniref:EGF-like domain-containing protein n=1 Tax=Cavenderia fasciculata TaxID=261658 RepID=F4Q836_CACFS|nr:uncharacterized protein DFA_09607 [Cavenderia fasciculata]EGG15936.1 hypothetical protein DFA_09607 [Cavenderia fasciculata]|eukprot:XP_004352261.1 hypothetical protein DFA_09607 [Cavenderia fasciculata]
MGCFSTPLKSSFSAVVLLLFLLFTLIPQQTRSQSLPIDELRSAIFLIRQFQLNIGQDQTSVCSSTVFSCVVIDIDAHITEISLVGSTFTGGGLPDTNLVRLDFPKLNVLEIRQVVEVADNSINLLNLVRDLPLLQSIIINGYPQLTSVPVGFPINLTALQSIDLNYNGITSIPGFFNNTVASFISVLNPLVDISIDDTLNLPNLNILSIKYKAASLSSPKTFNLKSNSFPQLSGFSIVLENETIVTINYEIGVTKSIYCTTWMPVERYNSLCHLQIKNTSSLVTLDLSGTLPTSTLSPVINSINYPALVNLGYTSFPLSQFPPNLTNIQLKGNYINFIGVTMPPQVKSLDLSFNQLVNIDFGTIFANSVWLDLNVASNLGLVTPVPVSMCKNTIHIENTAIPTVPDCFWCNYNMTAWFSTSLPYPSTFACDFKFLPNIIYTINGQGILKGTNIGYGGYGGLSMATTPNSIIPLNITRPAWSPIPYSFFLNPLEKWSANVQITDVTIDFISPPVLFSQRAYNLWIDMQIIQNDNFTSEARLTSQLTGKVTMCSFSMSDGTRLILETIGTLQNGPHILNISNPLTYDTAQFNFTQAYPIISNVSPNYLVYGTSITINGEFGTAPRTFDSILIQNSTYSVPCTYMGIFNNNLLQCTLYAYAPLGVTYMNVTENGYWTTYAYSYTTPQSQCNLETNRCSGNGYCNETGQCLCNNDGGYYNNCSKPYPVIGSGEYNLNQTRNISLYGDFGPFGQSNLSIKVNNTFDCSVVDKSQQVIHCQLSNQPNYGLSSVQLLVDGENTNVRNILQLRQPNPNNNNGGTTTTNPISTTTTTTTTTSGSSTDTPQQLCIQQTSNCYGHGTCDVYGICQCDKDYNQDDECFTKFINTTITPNTTDPTVSFDIDGIDFQFEIVSIQELDLNGDVVNNKELLISDYTWIVNASTNNITTVVDYQLNTTLANPTGNESSPSFDYFQSVSVLSTISFSTQPRDIQFGDQLLHINPNSIKLAINITNWQYSSNLATLRVVFRTVIINNQTVQYDCNEKEIDPLSYDSLSSLQYLRVIKDDIQFNGRFIDVALSNGRPTYSQTQLISLTQSTSNVNESVALLGINLPQCQSCVLDPDFTPLLIDKGTGGNDKCGGGGSAQSTAWRIAVGVVVGGIAAIALATASIIYYKKKKLNRLYDKKVANKLKKGYPSFISNSEYVEKDLQEGVLVCTQCGTLLEPDATLTNEDLFGTSIVYKDHSLQSGIPGGTNPSSRAFKKRSYHTYSKGSSGNGNGSNGCTNRNGKATSSAPNVTNEMSNHMITQIDAISETLGFNTGLKQELFTLCTFTIRKLPNLKFMRTRLIVAAIANIIIKQNKKPISLLEISTKVGVEFYALGKITRHIIKDMEIEVTTTDSDIHIFIDRVFSRFNESYAGDQLKSLKKLTVEIIHFLSLNHVIEGRHPPTMVCCSVYLSMKTLESKTKIPPDLNKLIEILSIKSTAGFTKRIKEIEQLLINYSKQQTQTSILKSMTINVKNLPHYTSFIVNDCLMNCQSRINDEDDLLYEDGDLVIENNNNNNGQDNGSLSSASSGEEEEESDHSPQQQQQETITSTTTTNSTPPSTTTTTTSIIVYNEPNEVEPTLESTKKKKRIRKPKKPGRAPNFKDYLSMCDLIGCPPSFINTSYKEMRRRLNVIGAKQRLITVMSPDQLPANISVTADDLEFLKKYQIFSNSNPNVGKQSLMQLHQHLTNVENLPSPAISMMDMDNFDLESYIPNSSNIYETLLLNNISEKRIIEGVFDLSEIESKKILSTHPNLSSTELSEHDMSNSEMSSYLRTSSEKLRLQMILSTLDNNNNNDDDDSSSPSPSPRKLLPPPLPPSTPLSPKPKQPLLRLKDNNQKQEQEEQVVEKLKKETQKEDIKVIDEDEDQDDEDEEDEDSEDDKADNDDNCRSLYSHNGTYEDDDDY